MTESLHLRVDPNSGAVSFRGDASAKMVVLRPKAVAVPDRLSGGAARRGPTLHFTVLSKWSVRLTRAEGSLSLSYMATPEPRDFPFLVIYDRESCDDYIAALLSLWPERFVVESAGEQPPLPEQV